MIQQAGIPLPAVFSIKLLHELPTEVLKQRFLERSYYHLSHEIFDYLYHSLRDLKKEVFKVIYLNNQNKIIDTSDLFEGTVTGGSISPREVMESALKHNTVSLIFVHNHPSGNPEPSQSDRDITRDLLYAGSIMQLYICQVL